MYSTPWTATFDWPIMASRALKNGGPAIEPTLPSSRVPRAKIIVERRQDSEVRSFRVMEKVLRSESSAERVETVVNPRGWIGAGEQSVTGIERSRKSRGFSSMMGDEKEGRKLR